MSAEGTILAADEFVVFDEIELGFSFSSSGEVIMLSAPDGISGLDFYDFGQQVADMSEGRFGDGAFPNPFNPQTEISFSLGRQR